ncbi:TerD family protein [uncultured Moraxella sp.]|uniref:TerD family protein n=1 Tax=uncultured Moraxella sp. TaxID=263769 RepID=UPI0025FAD7D4|nr:TerD family protein [uncultured Moraxella sp.]
MSTIQTDTTLPVAPLAISPLSEHSLIELGLLGNSLVACVSYHETKLARRGLDALLAKLPIMPKGSIALDIDLSCLMYDHQHQLVDCVWYGQLRNTNESIRHGGDALNGAINFEESLINQEEIRLRPDEIDASVSHLVFVMTSYHHQPLRLAQKAVASFMDNEQNIAHQFKLDTLPKDCTALITWHLHRSGDDWLIQSPLMPITPARQSEQHINTLDTAIKEYLGKTIRF